MRDAFSAVLLLLALALPACSSEPVVAPSGNDDVPEVASRSQNWTDEECAAWASDDDLGVLALTVRDVGTSAPITDCDYHSVRFALERDLVERHPPRMIDGPRRPGAVDGRYRWKLAAGWHQIRVDADGYRNAWTPVFRIDAGQETSLDLAMRESNRLHVTLLDENGDPVPDGGVLLTGDGYRGGMHIANGVGERSLPVDEISITVGDVFMEDYAFQEVTIPLRPGVSNEVTIRLRR